MTRSLFLVISLFVILSNVRSQENIVYDKIQDLKENGTVFARHDVLKQVSSSGIFPKIFKTPNEVVFAKAETDKLSELEATISILVPTSSKTLVLELREVNNPNFEIKNQDGKVYLLEKNKIRTFRGCIQGDKSSLASITIAHNQINGLVINKEGNYNIAYNKNTNQHVIYNDKNLAYTPRMQCNNNSEPLMGDKSSDFKGYKPEILDRRSKTVKGLSEEKCVRVYYESCYDTYQYNGSNFFATILYIHSLFNNVSLLYENENVKLILHQMVVWEIPGTVYTTDPYASSSTLLSSFKAHRSTTYSGDVAQLITNRNYYGESAWINSLCETDRSKTMSVAGLGWHPLDVIQPVPTWSYPVWVSTHEFGHLLGSQHTHACVWNGNNTQIDDCGNCRESIVFPATGTCNNCVTGPIPPAVDATIMSYCLPVNFSVGFGWQPGNVIRNSVASASCLSTCE